MRKFLRFIIFVLVAILIGGIVFVILSRNGGRTPSHPTTSGEISKIGSGEQTKNLADEVVVETGTYKVTTDHKFIDCEYPKIKSFKNASKMKYINDLIVEDINQYRDEIDVMLEDEISLLLTESGEEESKIKPTDRYRYVVSYEKFTFDKYLFLVVSQEYNSGGIRSVKFKDIYSIDVTTETIVELSEMFEPGVHFESAIIAEIQKQAVGRNIELMGGNGIKSLKKSQKFYIKDSKLIIYFAPAEVAANVYGELSFEMPFTLKANGTFEINS